MIPLILATSLAQAAPAHQVHLEGDFFGATFDTPLRIEAAPSTSDPSAVLESNALALAPLARWVEVAAEAADLDDFGRFQLIVTAVDHLPVRLRDVQAPPRVVGDALATGSWTRADRVLAIGGAMRAAGLAVAPFRTDEGRLLLGVAVADDGLNVDAVTQRWRIDGRNRSVQWVLYDGSERLGLVTPGGSLDGVRGLASRPPRRRAMQLGSGEPPAFTLARRQRGQFRVYDTGARVSYTRFPDAARWLRLFPEREFAHDVAFARRELVRMGLTDELRRALAPLSDEVERMDVLIRTVQAAFTYEPGPVRSMHELVVDGRGDCDQLSLFLAAALLELGYSDRDVVAVSWPGHLGLAVRARSGNGPDGSVGVDLPTGRHHLVDVTRYRTLDGRLVSRWGETAPEHGRSVQVVSLVSPRG